MRFGETVEYRKYAGRGGMKRGMRRGSHVRASVAAWGTRAHFAARAPVPYFDAPRHMTRRPAIPSLDLTQSGREPLTATTSTSRIPTCS